MAWRGEWVVSALSHNALDGKDVVPVTDEPPISAAQLDRLVTSDVWVR